MPNAEYELDLPLNPLPKIANFSTAKRGGGLLRYDGAMVAIRVSGGAGRVVFANSTLIGEGC